MTLARFWLYSLIKGVLGSLQNSVAAGITFERSLGSLRSSLQGISGIGDFVNPKPQTLDPKPLTSTVGVYYYMGQSDESLQIGSDYA